MIARLAVPLAVAAAQLGAALAALGRPDPGLALAFLAGDWPTATEALAALQLLVWAIVAACAARGVLVAARETARHVGARWLWEGSALAVGLLILAAGLARHLSFDVGMSGGSIQEARSVLGH
jgi:hypothetical protein